jgi:hypothetical protein
LIRVWVTYTNTGNEEPDKPRHFPPGKPFAFLASPSQRPQPGATDCRPEGIKCPPVAGHSKVVEVTLDDSAQPPPYLKGVTVTIATQGLFDFPEFVPLPFGNGVAFQQKAAVTSAP